MRHPYLGPGCTEAPRQRRRPERQKHTTSLGSRTLCNSRARNVHLPFPKALRHRLALGTSVAVELGISSTPPNEACKKATVAIAEPTTPMAKALAAPQRRPK